MNVSKEGFKQRGVSTMARRGKVVVRTNINLDSNDTSCVVMEIESDEESRVGPLLSVQSLTPTHYGRIPGHS